MANKIKVSDYIANFLVENDLTDVFMVTGGGAMHLNHSLGSHKDLQCTFNHHEQACAMAADSYARITGRPALVNVTTGPGGINALNGVFGAYTDSLPMIVVSGQVKFTTTVHCTDLPLRQLGDQEYDIIPSLKPMTKYAVMITDPNQIKVELKKCLKICKAGRAGPVWLDVPMDVQGAYIDESQLIDINDSDIETDEPPLVDDAIIEEVLTKIQESKRPVLFAGGGVRISGRHKEFIELLDTLAIPAVSGWNAYDTIPEDNPQYAGRPGTVGDRTGNFVVQNADLLLIMGSRINIRQVGYDWQSFSRESYKIMFDADTSEMLKPTLKIDKAIHCNLTDLLPRLLAAAKKKDFSPKTNWLDYCKDKLQRYPVLQEHHKTNAKVNPYYFVEQLTSLLPENQITVTGDGSACVIPFQVGHIKKGQRLFTNSGSASMGFDLPAAIGASIALNNQADVLCYAGDGSIMMNLQELQTIASNKLKIKIVIFNNSGYLSIMQTHANYFNGKLVGCDPSSGVSFPDFEKVSHAFGLPFRKIEKHDLMQKNLKDFLEIDGAAILEVMLDPEQVFEPKASSMRLEDGTMVSRPLEDLAPFLSREELKENMMVKML